jgi:hypothetical protein
MRFSSADGSFFDLAIAGYQFPSEHRAEYDSNWLVVEGRAALHGREWAFREPCLLTYEVERLADWLEQLAVGKAVEGSEDFVEPNIAFSAASGAVGEHVLAVILDLEARASWAEKQETLSLEFQLAPADLLAAAADLRGQLARFPQRAAR